MILSYDLAVKLKMWMEKPGRAYLEDASGNAMDISGKGRLVVRENQGFLNVIKVLVSKSLGQDQLVVGLEDLKTLHILHNDFPRQSLGTGGRGTTLSGGERGSRGAGKCKRGVLAPGGEVKGDG